ncbi:CCT domain [Sesbania bispinosa]|nr:CCT domain [Sesbania bispinosa]
MSSDLYTFDISFYKHSSPDFASYEYDGNGDLLFFSDPYPFPILTASPPIEGNLLINNSPDTFSSSFFSFSPPSTHLENHNLYQQANTTIQPLTNVKTEFGNFSAALDESGVKSDEECQIGVDYTYNYNHHFVPENASKLMHRSYSCNSFDGKPDTSPFEAHLADTTLMDSPNFQWHAPQNSFLNAEMRRVCSAGDLQNMKATHTSHQTESPLSEEVNFKVGRYSAEERKEKISKYRAKRSQRKFNKIIKQYACRKTLADNRTRIRGRFARNDETSEIPKAPCSTTEEYEDEFWVEFIEGLS